MTTKSKKLRVLYDCNRCPAYCCTYAYIPVEEEDIDRLAARFGLDAETATRRFTARGRERDERVLRHKKDPLFGTACRFLDLEARRCTVYEHRPAICREYPETRRCGYYELLKFERRAQDDDGVVVTAWVTLPS